MRKNLLCVALAASALSLASCSGEADADGDGHDHGAHSSAAELPADATEYAVACACSLEPGADCANMVEVEGEYIPLTGDLGLGDMEFCGQSDLHASMSGAVEDGEFVATAYAPSK